MPAQIKKTLIGIAIVACLVGIVWLIRTQKAQVAPQQTQNPRAEKIKGDLNAPVTIIEFSDFQCPSCAFAQPSITRLFEKFPGMIQLHAYHFPLAMHRFGMDSALAAECAAEQKKFWAYHDMLFREQKKWSADSDAKTLFLAYANDLELDRELFKSCFLNPETARKVEEDRQAGIKLQVSSTPTFFIGEERLVGAKQLDEKGPEIIQDKLESLVQKK